MPGLTRQVNAKLAKVPTVEIGGRGTFMYILCKIYEDSDVTDTKLIIRGNMDALFHADIYDAVDASLENEGITCVCLGGGKIKHNPDLRTLEIFDESPAYGKANHAITASMLEKTYPTYSIIWLD